MPTETLSYAQSLRVIGQDLENLGINSFELEKIGDEYIVRTIRNDTGRKSSHGVLTTITEKILGPEASAGEIPNPLRFGTPAILRSDRQRRLKRCEPDGMPLRNLSLVLRVLGDYLDRKRARDFVISWSTYSAKVSYAQKAEYFTVENLYDWGISMYLKRSTRSAAT